MGTLRIRIVRGVCLGDGIDAEVGEIHSVKASVGYSLIASGAAALAGAGEGKDHPDVAAEVTTRDPAPKAGKGGKS